MKARIAIRFGVVLLIAACSDSTDPAPDEVDAVADVDVGADSDSDDDTGADPGEDLGGTPEPDVSIEPSARIEAPDYAFVNQEVIFVASDSIHAVSFHWRLSDGTEFGPSEDPTLAVSWSDVARERVTLTVESESGNIDRATALVTVVEPPAWAPQRSGNLAVDSVASEVAVLAADAGELSVFDASTDGLPLLERYEVCEGARTVTNFEDGWAISCPWQDRVEILSRDGTIEALELAWGSRPFAVVSHADDLLVSYQARGAVVRFARIDGEFVAEDFWAGLEDARDLTLAPSPTGERLFVTRWRSPDGGGEITSIDLGSGERAVVELPFDDQPPSDTETGGVPTYLGAVAVAPSGAEAAVPCLQANVAAGLTRNGEALTHESTVRAALAYLTLGETVGETTDNRKRFDDRGFASAAVYSRFGDFLYVAMRGSRTVERIDVLSDTQSGAELNVGFAPSDIALSGNGRRLYVHAELSRELVVYDTERFGQPGSEVGRVSTVSTEPFSDEVLLGAQLFNDSFDIRIARDSYIACSHCHLDGESDRRTWDFTARGEGVRNTTSLLGRAGTAHGPVHWSANFDEIQDFEHDMRGPFQGLGLMSDEDFHDGRDHPMAGPKAGASAELDALAAYVASLDRFPLSPARLDDGNLTEEAARGRALFEDPTRRCLACHSGESMTDSALLEDGPLLHDVGTMTELSGTRLGQVLIGIDTPTLRGLWNDAPYLHDGSAETIRDVIDRNVDDAHGVTSDLSDSERSDLAEYLLSIE